MTQTNVVYITKADCWKYRGGQHNRHRFRSRVGLGRLEQSDSDPISISAIYLNSRWSVLEKSRSARAARDLPLVVPGFVLLQEPGEARMHWDVRIGVDAPHLHPDEVARHVGEARIALRQLVLAAVEGGHHPVDEILAQARPDVVGEEERHAEDFLDADILAERVLRVERGDLQAGCLELLDLRRAWIDHRYIDAPLGLLPVGSKRAAGRRIGDRAGDRAGLQGRGLRPGIDRRVLELVAEGLVDPLEVQPVHEAHRG